MVSEMRFDVAQGDQIIFSALDCDEQWAQIPVFVQLFSGNFQQIRGFLMRFDAYIRRSDCF